MKREFIQYRLIHHCGLIIWKFVDKWLGCLLINALNVCGLMILICQRQLYAFSSEKTVLKRFPGNSHNTSQEDSS